MKKILALILALVMSLALVACGGGEEAPAGDDGAAETEAEGKVPQVAAGGRWAGEGLHDPHRCPLLAPDGFLHQSHGPYRQPGTPGSTV